MSKKDLVLLCMITVLIVFAFNLRVHASDTLSDDYYADCNEIEGYDKEYKICQSLTQYQTDNKVYSYTSIISMSECVLYLNPSTDEKRYCLVSDEPFFYTTNYISEDWTDSKSMNIDVVSWNYDDIKIYNASYGYAETNSTEDSVIHFTGLKVFDSLESVVEYYKTGNTDGVIQNATKEYNNELIALNEFNMLLYDSNDYDEVKVKFTFEPTEYLKENNGMLHIVATFDFQYEVLSGVLDIGEVSGIDGTTFECDVSVSTGECVIKPSDYFCHSWDFIEQLIVGKEMVVDSNMGTEVLVDITKSSIYFTVTPYVNATYGKIYNACANLLQPSNSYYDEVEYDKEQSDYIEDGYVDMTDGYVTVETSTDGYGNTIYNYYYTDNSTHETTVINSDDDIPTSDTESGGSGESTTVEGSTVTNNNNPTQSPTFNNTPTFNNDVNVTVEGDSINNEVDNIVNGDTTSTKEENESFINKVMGFFNPLVNNSFILALSSLVSWLPAELLTLITSAIGISVGIAVWKFFRK